MSGANDVVISHSCTGGQYKVFAPRNEFPLGKWVITSDTDASAEEGFSTRDLETIRTESDKGISIENAVDIITTIMPDVSYFLTTRQLDSIKNRSERIGSINAHLDSIEESIKALKMSYDARLEILESIKARL